MNTNDKKNKIEFQLVIYEPWKKPKNNKKLRMGKNSKEILNEFYRQLKIEEPTIIDTEITYEMVAKLKATKQTFSFVTEEDFIRLTAKAADIARKVGEVKIRSRKGKIVMAILCNKKLHKKSNKERVKTKNSKK